LGGSVDAFTTAGVVYFLCKDYPKSIASFQNALRLVPNDNGWFITRYLGTTLYRAKDFSSLQKLIEEDIDSEDMPPVLIAYYSFIMLENGEKGKAKEYFDLAKSKGLSKKYLTRYDMNDEIFQNFKVKMQEIGVLE
jgi:tetratricopeptide (TPR) repeat protein